MFLKRLVIIIIVVVVVALGFQAIRSFLLLRFVDNVNTFEDLGEPESAQLPEGLKEEKYLLVVDNQTENSTKTAGEVKKVLGYMKKPYDVLDITEVEDTSFEYDGILVITERLDNIGDMLDYLSYVDSGGNLILLIRPVTDETFRIYHKYFGIQAYEKEMIESTGIKINTDILLGAEGFESSSEGITNSSLDVSLDNSCDVHVTSFYDIPLLWKKESGQGSIVVFNGTMLNEKINRGLVTASLDLAIDDLIYPIINSKMLHIDDFPAPIPEGNDPVIYSEFQRDIPMFYKEIWWSDMVKYSKLNDLTYSAFVIENYGNDVTPPFQEASDRDVENLLVYGKELLRLGGEIGLHGYNHQSLAYSGYIKQDLGYNPWSSVEDMAKSQQALIEFIKQVFSDYELRAYVPPSNILSPQGRQAIKQANPDLKIIASVYLTNAEGDVYTQEFSVADDGIIEMPRLSSGYHYEDEVLWAIYNGANMPGIFAHFIHPDDILDPDRNKGKSWSEMTKEYEKILEIIGSEYWWLRSQTISESANELVKYLDCKLHIQNLGEEIEIYSEDFRKSIYCILRTDKDITGKQGCDYMKIGSSTYLVTINEVEASLYLRGDED